MNRLGFAQAARVFVGGDAVELGLTYDHLRFGEATLWRASVRIFRWRFFGANGGVGDALCRVEG